MGTIYKGLGMRWEVGRRRNRASANAYPPPMYATAAPIKSATAQERPFSAVFSPLQGPAHFPAIAGGFGR
nr:MAG TPA: hypothetical protein [Caudoviricetes sp.]